MYGLCMSYVWFMYENSMATVYLRHTSGMVQVCLRYEIRMKAVYRHILISTNISQTRMIASYQFTIDA